MKSQMKLNLFLLITLLVVLLTSYSSSDVSPDVILEKVKKGESVHVIKRVTTPEFPPMIDLVVLQDETQSFADDIQLVQGTEIDCSDGLGAALYDELMSRTEFMRFGVAGFMDFYDEGQVWGSPGDVPFMFVSDLTADRDVYLNGICSLVATGGGDIPESQLYALLQSSTDFSWSTSSNVFRAVVLITDAPAHTPTSGYPGPSEADTISMLQDQNIHVIVLQAPGASGYDAIAEATGGVIKEISDDSSDIIDAILEAFGDITADLIPVLRDCDPRLTVKFDPPFVDDAAMSDEYIFIETIHVSDHFYSKKDEKLKCTVDFVLMDEEGPSVGQELIFILPENKDKKRCVRQCCR